MRYMSIRAWYGVSSDITYNELKFGQACLKLICESEVENGQERVVMCSSIVK